MTEVKRLVFESVAGDVLRRFGYDPDKWVCETVARCLYEFRCIIDRGGHMQLFAARVGLLRTSKLEQDACRAG